MRGMIVAAVCVGSLVAGSATAEAKGCIKGAIVGGIAGHLAGHGVAGALAGCVAGRAASHYANKPRTVQPGGTTMQQTGPSGQPVTQ